MAITIQHTYSTSVRICYYSKEGTTFFQNDSGTLDDITERTIDMIVKYNFIYVDVCDAETGEVLMIIERT